MVDAVVEDPVTDAASGETHHGGSQTRRKIGRDYHKSGIFHQVNPTIVQIRMFGTHVIRPSFHQGAQPDITGTKQNRPGSGELDDWLRAGEEVTQKVRAIAA